MIQSYYVCPFCETYTGDMDLSEERHTPHSTELQKRPWALPIAHEILICKCGVELTWFTVEEKFTQSEEGSTNE